MRIRLALILSCLVMTAACGGGGGNTANQSPAVTSGCGLSGSVLTSNGSAPLIGVVALETITHSLGSTNYQIIAVTKPDVSGKFHFCDRNTNTSAEYLLLIAAQDNTSTGEYTPVLITNVRISLSTETDVGTYKLDTPHSTASLGGFVTTATSAKTPAPANYAVSLLGSATDDSGTSFQYEVWPTFALPSQAGWFCNIAFCGPTIPPATTTVIVACGTGFACGIYDLDAPVTSPIVYRMGRSSSVQATTTPSYVVSAVVRVGTSSTQPNCAPSTLATGSQTNGQPLTADFPNLYVQTLAFTGCQ